jgi:hypothetical protein
MSYGGVYWSYEEAIKLFRIRIYDEQDQLTRIRSFFPEQGDILQKKNGKSYFYYHHCGWEEIIPPDYWILIEE